MRPKAAASRHPAVPSGVRLRGRQAGDAGAPGQLQQQPRRLTGSAEPAADRDAAADRAALVTALEQERARVAALAAALWQHLGALALAVVAAWSDARDAASGIAQRAAAEVPALTAAAADGLSAARGAIAGAALSGEARAAALAAAAQSVATLARATGLERAANPRRLAAGVLAPLAAGASRASAAVAARLRAPAPAASASRAAMREAALLGTLVSHIPLVRGLVRGRREAADADWDWAGANDAAVAARGEGWPAGVRAAIADAGAWAGHTAGVAAAGARGAAVKAQCALAEPVSRCGAFVTENRGVSLAVGGAAAALLALAALRRVVEVSASAAEERVLRQLELQRRAEELASVRSRIRGALDASEPDRESRQMRQAASADDDAEAAALTERAGSPAPRGAGAFTRLRASRDAGAAEEEAVRRFQAFVAASGMGDMLRAGDGRMWDVSRAEGPQASREAVDAATRAFRNLGPSSEEALEADRADAQRQLEDQMAALAALEPTGLGRAAREAAKQRQREGGGEGAEAPAPPRARGGGGGGGGAGANPFALSAEERARWDAEEHLYSSTDGAAARRQSRPSSPPARQPPSPPRAQGREQQGQRGPTADGGGGGAAVGASVRGRLGLAGGERPVAAAAVVDGPAGEAAPAQPPAVAAEAAAGSPPEAQAGGEVDWEEARREMAARGSARRARREAAVDAPSGGGDGGAGAAAQPAEPAARQEAKAALRTAVEAMGADGAAAAATAAAAAERDASEVVAQPLPVQEARDAAAASSSAPAAAGRRQSRSARRAARKAARRGAPEDNPFAVDPAAAAEEGAAANGGDDDSLFQGLRIVERR
ncbi:hypothetical protein Rsub_08201 [Raphidocelis subcapitata]|uniref:Uncharacterized protein n=1 Tax=Raphidocelis subcapitata TaxID=307507 RepID=A0A2V0PFB3_9CHLO|nr:hypothetical protein Rsub_08201 [Raphidocelis subcapitata]|eukprot:GBF95765.1 hypothetical protein Rsub_08201 [Raphidocelis subcapitata]